MFNLKLFLSSTMFSVWQCFCLYRFLLLEVEMLYQAKYENANLLFLSSLMSYDGYNMFVIIIKLYSLHGWNNIFVLQNQRFQQHRNRIEYMKNILKFNLYLLQQQPTWCKILMFSFISNKCATSLQLRFTFLPDF